MAAKKTTTAKKAAPKAAKPAAAKKTASTGAATAAKTKPAKTGAAKKPAIKLTDKQADFLKKIDAAGENGYDVAGVEKRSVEALKEKKLVKTKTDKATKKVSAFLTAAGKKKITSKA